MATRHNITIEQASTYVLVIDVVGGPDDLTDYTAELTVRQIKGAPEPLAYFGPERFTVEPLTRQVIAEIPDEVTALYDWGRPAVYDCYIEGPTGDRWRLIEGLAALSKTVTTEA